MNSSKLNVFIGSSGESLHVARAIERHLSKNPRLRVTVWPELHRQIGRFFLDDLMGAAPSYDAAILHLGSDDETISRGKKEFAPRDNVIFELGVFMGTLGKERAIIVAPKPWEAQLRIMTDIAHIAMVTYSPPRIPSSLPENKKGAIWKETLREAAKDIDAYLTSLELRGIAHPESVGSVLPEVIDVLGTGKSRSLRNIALDMEQTWPPIRDNILAKPSVRNVVIETMMIDGHSDQIRRMSSSTVDLRVARTVEHSMVKYLKEHQQELAARRVRFCCRAYSDVPLLHGFLVKRTTLMMSLCGIKNGRLDGAPNPYIRFDYPTHKSRNLGAIYYFKTFDAWFDFRWKSARRIWPES